MSDNCSSNITQILTSFESFIKMLEEPNWMKTAKIEDIKTTFKLGAFVEKTTDHFITINGLESFLNILTNWLKIKDRTKIYSENVYKLACDELIIKFFSSSNISKENLDIAVRVYTSIFPKKRFEEVLTRILLNSGNLEALSDYVKEVFSDSDSEYLGYHFKLQHWTSMMQRGQLNSVKEEIKSILSPYNVEIFLYVLIGILTLSELSSDEKSIQKIILENLLEKMSERNILTKQLWTTLFKIIDRKSLSAVCNNFSDFLNSILNFIVYTGSMMNKVGNFWKNDPNICFYPDIEYEDITTHLFEFCHFKDNFKQTIFNKLNEAKEFTDTNIWDQILAEIQ